MLISEVSCITQLTACSLVNTCRKDTPTTGLLLRADLLSRANENILSKWYRSYCVTLQGGKVDRGHIKLILVG
jgi:hypothetical protein